MHRPELDRRRVPACCTGNTETGGIVLGGNPGQGNVIRMSFQCGQAAACGHCPRDDSQTQPLVCDEAVSALDATTQAQIIELLQTLRREEGLVDLHQSAQSGGGAGSYDRVLVLYLGRMMELASAADLYERPWYILIRGHYWMRSLWQIRTLQPAPGESTGGEQFSTHTTVRCVFCRGARM